MAKHVGFFAMSASGYRTLIHAYWGRGVIGFPLTPSWERRVAATFRFPSRRI